MTSRLLVCTTIREILPSTEMEKTAESQVCKGKVTSDWVRYLLGIQGEILNKYQSLDRVQEKDLSNTEKSRALITLGSSSSLKSKT